MTVRGRGGGFDLRLSGQWQPSLDFGTRSTGPLICQTFSEEYASERLQPCSEKKAGVRKTRLVVEQYAFGHLGHGDLEFLFGMCSIGSVDLTCWVGGYAICRPNRPNSAGDSRFECNLGYVPKELKGRFC